MSFIVTVLPDYRHRVVDILTVVTVRLTIAPISVVRINIKMIVTETKATYKRYDTTTIIMSTEAHGFRRDSVET